MKTACYLHPTHGLRIRRALTRDARGAVLIEAAVLLPIILMILVGTINYGMWFMAAHAIQQAANEGARASLAGLDATERQSLANDAITKSIAPVTIVNPSLVTVTTSTSGSFYTVTVKYNVSQAKLFATALLPMPQNAIQRASVVKLASM